MPDIQNYAITALAPASVSVPRFLMSGQVCDSRTGAVLRDFTGANAVTFPNFLSGLTAAEQMTLAGVISDWYVRTKLFP